jgi:hypothetical protein
MFTGLPKRRHAIMVSAARGGRRGRAMAGEDRRQRLAAALRENLRRRKAQDRGRRQQGPDEAPGSAANQPREPDPEEPGAGSGVARRECD